MSEQKTWEFKHYGEPTPEERRRPKRPPQSPDDAPRSHRCPHCTFSCDRPSTLAKHLRTHNGERPHGCPFCDRRFPTASNLYRHMRGCQDKPEDVLVDAEFIASFKAAGSSPSPATSGNDSSGAASGSVSELADVESIQSPPLSDHLANPQTTAATTPDDVVDPIVAHIDHSKEDTTARPFSFSHIDAPLQAGEGSSSIEQALNEVIIDPQLLTSVTDTPRESIMLEDYEEEVPE